MSRSINPSRAFRCLAFTAFFAASFAIWQPASATTVLPLTLTETIRQADTVIVGSVVSKSTRWSTDAKRLMETDYTLHVEQVVVPGAGAVSVNQTIVVNYWGGTLDGQTQEVAGVRLPQIGERLVLMLKPEWHTKDHFTPVIGFNYGLLSVVPSQADGSPLVYDAEGAPLVRSADGQVAWKADASADAGSQTVDLSAFTAWLRENVGAIKAAPSELKPHPDRNDPRVMRVFAKTAESDSGARSYAGPETPGNLPASEGIAEVPLRPEFWTNHAAAARETSFPGQPDYSYEKKANSPVTINHFPSSWAPWSPEDQYQMTKWNYYADIFRISTSPTGTFGYPNGRWDLAGWLTPDQLQETYMRTWGASEIAVCIRGWNAQFIILEADIALNPAFSYTLDDEWILNGSTAVSFRHVLTHELGHMFGLDHNFNALASLNYLPPQYTFFGLPYMDDAEGMRSIFPAQTASRTDLAIYLYAASGSQNASDAIHPTTLTAGTTLTVSNYHLENVGTTTITTPRIEWYLTPARNFSGTNYYLGASTHESLARFTAANLANTSRSFTVPASVPAGTYYLAAFIRDDGGATQATFPFSNNSAFSRRTIQVTPPGGSVRVTISPAGAVSAGAQWQVNGGAWHNSSVTVGNLTAGSHTISFKPVSGWNTPSSQTVTVNTGATTTATGTYEVPTGAVQVTISPAGAVSAGAQWQVDGGAFRNSGTTASGLSVGSHTVSFKAVSGWTTPASQTVTVSANNTSTTTGTYTAVTSTGSLQVTISPAGAVSAGAQWQVDGGAFQNSGTTVSNLSVGSHTVAFKSISGWTTPASQTVTISANTTATASGTYIAAPTTGSLQVTINPAGAVSAGAQWQVDGGAFQNSGAIVSNLSPGDHTISFKPVSGWSTPSNQIMPVSAGTTNSTSGTYTAAATTGSLRVTINPAGAVNAGAQWQVDGGAFQDSGATLSGLTPGDHTISFKPISGWTTPSNQIMPVTAGVTNATSATYTAPPLQLMSAVSRKTHGTSGVFDIPLSLSTPASVECRTGGGNRDHTLVFTFNADVVSGNASVSSSGGGSVTSTSFSGNTMTVALTGVNNAQRVTVTLNNVTSGTSQVLSSTVTVGFLVGDTNGSSSVNTSDIGQTKAQSGQVVSASNFRTDVTANGGSISSSDVGLVKSAAGSVIAP